MSARTNTLTGAARHLQSEPTRSALKVSPLLTSAKVKKLPSFSKLYPRIWLCPECPHLAAWPKSYPPTRGVKCSCARMAALLTTPRGPGPREAQHLSRERYTEYRMDTQRVTRRFRALGF